MQETKSQDSSVTSKQKNVWEPYSFFHADFRPPSFDPRTIKLPFRVLVWNIERGYKLKEIIKHLKEVNAHILCLQEVDIGCKRSAEIDEATRIAQELQMNVLWACEMQLLEGGSSGSAILSKFDFETVGSLPLKHQPVDYFKDGPNCSRFSLEYLNPYSIGNCPRIGGRCAAVATIRVPASEKEWKLVRCFSIHLEMHRGMDGRLKQLADLLENDKLSGSQYTIISGDMNTVSSSIAKAIPKMYDSLNWKTFNVISEAALWKLFFPSHLEEKNNMESRFRSRPLKAIYDALPTVVQQLTDFIEPFDLCESTCSALYGYYREKIDWCISKKLNVVSKEVGNNELSMSDHKYLFVSYQF